MSTDQDKNFAMMMRMHYQKGIEMAQKKELANGKATKMKAMAKKILAAQTKESPISINGSRSKSREKAIGVDGKCFAPFEIALPCSTSVGRLQILKFDLIYQSTRIACKRLALIELSQNSP